MNKTIFTKKGFTLFTALISLLLLSMSLILIFNMVQSEETYLYLIADKSSLSDLVTIADLARADAYNSFLVHLRVSWEKHYTGSENPIILTYDDVYMSWDEFVKKKADSLIFSLSFADFFASVIVTQLRYGNLQPPGYNINIDVFGDENDPTSQKVLAGVIRQTFGAADDENRIKIVNCESDSDDECIGSFYLSLDMTDLADENYEKLPRVSVVSYKTDEVIQKPVFGRFVYRIYMPWRGFQALRVARRFALEESLEKLDSEDILDIVGPNGHKGLFDGYLVNTLNQARLGFCDPGTCAPRTELYTSPDTRKMEYSCYYEDNSDVPVDVSNINLPTINNHEIKLSPNQSYNAFSISEAKTILKNMFADTVEENIIERATGHLSEQLVFSNGLNMIFRTEAVSSNQQKIEAVESQGIKFIVSVESDNKKTKVVDTDTTSGNDSIIHSVSFSSFSQGMRSSVGGFGNFIFENDNKYISLLESQILNNYTKPSFFNQTQAYDLSCDQLETAYIQLSFEETDRRYIVGEEAKIHVNLRYSFSPYAFPPSAGPNAFTGYDIHNSGFLKENNIPENLTYNPNDWTCVITTELTGRKCISK